MEEKNNSEESGVHSYLLLSFSSGRDCAWNWALAFMWPQSETGVGGNRARDGWAWRAAIHGVAKSRTRLSD